MNRISTKERKIDLYDIGNGLELMNIRFFNENGKLVKLETYVGENEKGYVRVGSIADLDEPGVIFTYNWYVKQQAMLIGTYIQIYKESSYYNMYVKSNI